MNALGNSVGSSVGGQREQTMEEILASIRKIIESNEATIGSPTLEQLEPAKHQHSHYDDVDGVEPEAVLELTAIPQPMVVESAVEPVFEPASPTLQSEMAKLVSQTPERRVAAAFDDLNSAFIKSKSLPVEGVAEAMLRPMLKDWLDNNLPNLVERLVREEISRIARGDI